MRRPANVPPPAPPVEAPLTGRLRVVRAGLPTLWQHLVRSLRWARSLHRYVGVPLLLVVLLSSVTGVLLAWKKQSAALQPPTLRGASTHTEDWQPLHRLAAAAEGALQAQLGSADAAAPQLDRIEVRPSHGVAKVLFRPGYWEVQVDLTTGRVLSIHRRASDFIEALHDGSILGEHVKLASMSVLGLGLVLLGVSGAWLWLGPRLARRRPGPPRP